MTDIAGLLERVRAANGPDQELDAAVWLTVIPGATCRNLMEEWADERPIWEYHDPERNVYSRYLPDLSRSVDAALALVERKLPGWCWNIGHDARDELHATVWHGVTEHDEYGHTAPLAILAALLSALSSGDAS